VLVRVRPGAPTKFHPLFMAFFKNSALYLKPVSMENVDAPDKISFDDAIFHDISVTYMFTVAAHFLHIIRLGGRGL